ncbi:MAG: hypothetical protein JSR73_07085 [Proteobacteria bacterium]|nr:hypothetical protein [Pseudomonadota bacterium]
MAGWLAVLAASVLGATTDTAVVALPASGQALFERQWQPARPDGGGDGLGPLYNAPSCGSCHSDATHGHGPLSDGVVPAALVITLEAASSEARTEPAGDPVYGHVFNSAAVEGVRAEGTVTVRYHELAGTYYPGGTRWKIRVPEYRFETLNYGPLATRTVIKPRLAPALFGVGLLEAVPDDAITRGAAGARLAWQWRHGARYLGRFGWQSASLSVRDQVTKAFANEMGLTTPDRAHDDCTGRQPCAEPPPGPPEVDEASVAALVEYVKSIEVPPATHAQEEDAEGRRIFAAIGCPNCHRPELPVERTAPDGTRVTGTISPYTDLQVHDLGHGMADRDSTGRVVPSRWRTAPLWGIGFRMSRPERPVFLHDGRARTVEEAVLWHLGEATSEQRLFGELSPYRRAILLHWLETL